MEFIVKNHHFSSFFDTLDPKIEESEEKKAFILIFYFCFKREIKFYIIYYIQLKKYKN